MCFVEATMFCESKLQNSFNYLIKINCWYSNLKKKLSGVLFLEWNSCDLVFNKECFREENVRKIDQKLVSHINGSVNQ